MTKKKVDKSDHTALWKRAEEALTALDKSAVYPVDIGKMKELIRDLRVHQIEHEMQNEELRRLRLELAESQSKYADFHDFSPVGYFTFDRNGVITEVNAAGAELLEAERKSLIGKPFRLYIVSQSLRTFHSHTLCLIESHTKVSCELVLKRNGGTTFDASVKSISIRDLAGRAIGCRSVLTDITGQKRAEEQHRNILQTTMDAFWAMDVSGCILDVNEAFCKLTGYTREELLNMAISDLEASEGPSEIRTHIEKVIKVGQDRFETRHWRKDGTIADLEVSTNYSRVGGPRLFVFAHDITERKLAEHVLLEAQQRLDKAFRTMVDGVVIVVPDGKITYSNPAFLNMVGYTQDELYALTYEDLTPEKWHAHEENIIQDQVLKRGYSEVYEKEYIRKDGTIFPVEVRKHLLRDGNGNLAEMWLFVRDITGRKRVEKALQESEEKFRLLFEKSVDPIVLSDGDRYIDCNEAALKLMGCSSKNQLIGLRPTDTSPEYQPDGRLSSEKLEEHNLVTLQEGVNHFQWMRRTFDGEEFWVDVSQTVIPIQGRPIKYTVWRDIRERNKTEARLRESEERYRVAIEHSNDGVSLAREDRYIYVNLKFLEMFGYDRSEEVLGKTYSLIVHPEDLERVAEYDWKRQRGEPVPPAYEIRGIGKDGRTMYVEVSAAITTFLGHQVTLTYFRDVTERKRVEDALRESEEKYHTLFKESPEAISVVQNRRVVDANPAWLRMHGFQNKDEVLGMEILQIIHPEDREILIRRRNMLAEERSRGCEIRDMRKDGTVVCVETYSSPIVLKGKETFLTSLRDITEHKRVEDVIHSERRKLFLLVEQAPFGIVLIAGNRSFSYINRKFEGIFGFTADEIPDFRTWLMRIYPHRSYRQHVLKTWVEKAEKAQIGKTAPREFTVIGKDGDRKVVNLIVVVLSEGEAKDCLMVCEDVTERRRAERIVCEARLSQKAILDNIPDMAWLKDRKSRFVMVNETFARACGVGADQIVGKTDLHVWPRQLARKYMADDKEIVEFGLQKRVEEPLVDKEGRIQWLETIKTPIFDENKKVLGITAIAHDITQKRKVEQALRVSYRQLEQIKLEWELSVDSLQELLFLLDRQYRIIRTNRSVEAWGLGSFETGRGKELHEFLHQKCTDPHCYLKTVLLDSVHGIEHQHETSYEGKDDILKKHVWIRVRPFSDRDKAMARGSGSFAVVVIYDISERKEAERTLQGAYTRLQEAQQELVRSEKLALLGKFSSGVAHEIRNPLANIRASAQFCINKYALDEEIKRHLRIMVRNCDSANKIIKELIDLARPSESILTYGNVHDVITRVCDLVKTRCEKQRVIMHKRSSKRLPQILMDEECLEKAFLNFVLNGLDAMPKGGFLSINAYPDFSQEEVVVTILDTGKGISQENLEKIFHPFFTTKRDGVGLGLCLAEQVINSHKGKVTIASRIGQGTEIVIRFRTVRGMAERRATRDGTDTNC